MARELSPYGTALLKSVGGSPRANSLSAKAASRWGADQPSSVLHVLPEEFTRQIARLPDALSESTEVQLEGQIPEGITRQDRRVRIQFWEEYERAHREGRDMELGAVAKDTGLPSWAAYEGRLSQSEPLLAWLMKPPASYQLQMKEAHELGINRLTEILSLPLMQPVFGKDGQVGEKICPQVAMLILQAFKLIDQRRYGAVTQKNVNVNLDAPSAGMMLSMEEVDKKLAEISAQLEGTAPLPSQPSGKQEIEVESQS